MPRVSACEIGLMRSILSLGTNDTTELVPSTNMRAMIGVAMMTDRPMALVASRHSPAKIAMESNPPKAPKLILPSTFKLNREMTGRASVKGAA